MIVPELLQHIVIAMAIGGLIGVERERLPERKFIGLRTSAIIAMGGPLSVEISSLLSSIFPVIIYILLGAGISIYIIKIRMDVAEKHIGLTTSACVFLLVLLSLLVGYSYYFEAVAIAIITTFLLAGKERFKPYISELSTDEILDALKVAAAAFIIYPLLPSEPISSLGLINPQKILFFILVVLGIRFAAFVASRQLSGKRSLPLIGLLGGGVSSFATTATLSEITGEENINLKPIALGVILSAVAMVVRNIFVVSTSLQGMGRLLFAPGILIICIGILPAFAGYVKSSLDITKSQGEKLKKVLRSPLSFRPALKLGFYFLLITLAGNILRSLMGQQGLWAVALFGGLISSAAVAVSVISMASSGVVTIQAGAFMVILACISSILVKILVVRAAGNRELLKKVIPIFVIMSIVGIVPFLFL